MGVGHRRKKELLPWSLVEAPCQLKSSSTVSKKCCNGCNIIELLPYLYIVCENSYKLKSCHVYDLGEDIISFLTHFLGISNKIVNFVYSKVCPISWIPVK